MSFTLTVAVNCPQNTSVNGIIFSDKVGIVAFSSGKGRDKAFLLCGVVFAHAVPGGHMAGTTAVWYHWFVGNAVKWVIWTFAWRTPACFWTLFRELAHHVWFKEPAVPTVRLLPLWILSELLRFPPPAALSTTSAAWFIQDLNSSQESEGSACCFHIEKLGQSSTDSTFLK